MASASLSPKYTTDKIHVTCGSPKSMRVYKAESTNGHLSNFSVPADEWNHSEKQVSSCQL